MAWLTDRPDMTLDVYRGRKTTMQKNICTLTFKICGSVFTRTVEAIILKLGIY